MKNFDLIRVINGRWQVLMHGLSGLPVQAKSVFYLIVAVFALASVLALNNVLGWWVSSASEISATTPRMSRFLGYIDAASRIDLTLARVNEALSQVAIEDTGDSGRGGALLQQQLRQLASEAGLAVTGSELRDPEQLQKLARLRVSLSVAGPPEGFDELFALMFSASPMLFVDLVDMEASRRINRRRPREFNMGKADHISAKIEISAYRLSSKDADQSL